MYNFIILGHIPGTDIVVTFTMWLQLAFLILASYMLVYVHRSQVALVMPSHIGRDFGSALKPLN